MELGKVVYDHDKLHKLVMDHKQKIMDDVVLKGVNPPPPRSESGYQVDALSAIIDEETTNRSRKGYFVDPRWGRLIGQGETAHNRLYDMLQEQHHADYYNEIIRTATAAARNVAPRAFTLAAQLQEDNDRMQMQIDDVRDYIHQIREDDNNQRFFTHERYGIGMFTRNNVRTG